MPATKENRFTLKRSAAIPSSSQLLLSRIESPVLLRTSNFSREARYPKFYLKSPDFYFLNTMWAKQTTGCCPKFTTFNLAAD